MPESIRAVGIDLGTTYSAVAWIDESGRSAMVRNAEGELLTPSVVFFGDAEVVVGKDARSATTVHPDQVAEWVKRDMGSAVYSRPVRGEYLPPEVIQACILRKLRADLVEVLGPEVGVVITVPAYFDEPRRKATADAGEMAGLKVLDIVNEPTAAALAFGEVLGYLSATGGAADEMTLLVYDLGGGTFDATLLRLEPGDIRTLATDGDVRLGGYDWDMRLVDSVAEWFRQSQGADPRDDLAALKRLYNAVVDAKHALSARSRATIRLDYAGYSAEEQVTREEFEELTADLLERTAYTTRGLVAAASMEWDQVSRVLLVGGSTRMPMVARMLEQLSGVVPDHTVHPDEAVARGAAIYANYLLARQAGEGAAATFQVTNVNAHSLGVEGIEPETLRKTNVVLIPRNTPLPARFTETFTTKRAGQRSIVIQVLEGESSIPSECTAIGRTVVRDLPPDLPQGWPIQVTFEYATNGRLNVKTTIPGKEREVSLEMDREVGLSDEGISRWKRPVAASSGFDAFEAMLGDVLGLSGPGSEEEPPEEQPPSRRAHAGPSGGSPPAAPPTPPAGAPPTSRKASSPPAPRPKADRPSSTSPGAGDPTRTYQPTASSPARGAARAGDAGPPAQAPRAAGADRAPSHARSPRPTAPPTSDRPEWVAPGKPRKKRIPRWLIGVLGFIGSALIGLGLGYLIIALFFSESGIFPFW
jgi:molecular chaperone DnaK